jgi:hypothetical protein
LRGRILGKRPDGFPDPIALALDAIHQPPSPYELGREKTEPKENHEPARPRRDNHNYTGHQQSETGYDAKSAADLLDSADDHEMGPCAEGSENTRTYGGRGGTLARSVFYPTIHFLRSAQESRIDVSQFHDSRPLNRLLRTYDDPLVEALLGRRQVFGAGNGAGLCPNLRQGILKASITLENASC